MLPPHITGPWPNSYSTKAAHTEHFLLSTDESSLTALLNRPLHIFPLLKACIMNFFSQLKGEINMPTFNYVISISLVSFLACSDARLYSTFAREENEGRMIFSRELFNSVVIKNVT